MEQAPDISAVVSVEVPVSKKKPVRLSLVDAFKLNSLSDGIRHMLACHESKFNGAVDDGCIHNMYSLIAQEYMVRGNKLPVAFTYTNVRSHYNRE